MRKSLIVFLAILLFYGWTSLAYAEDIKIGYVNLKKVLDTYEKVKDGEDVLLGEANKKNQERDKMVKEIKNLREKIELLQDSQKEKKQKELDDKIKNLQDFTYQTRTSLRQKRDEKFMEIMKEVKDVIAEYGKSRNYNIIIDDSLLLYKDESFDITDDAIKTLNQRYKK